MANTELGAVTQLPSSPVVTMVSVVVSAQLVLAAVAGVIPRFRKGLARPTGRRGPRGTAAANNADATPDPDVG